MNGHTRVVLTLLRHAACPDLADKHGVTPVTVALQHSWNACANVICDWMTNKDGDLLKHEKLIAGTPPQTPLSPLCSAVGSSESVPCMHLRG